MTLQNVKDQSRSRRAYEGLVKNSVKNIIKLCFCLTFLSSCALNQTKRFHIQFGTDSPLHDSDITPDMAAQIDAAGMAAAMLVYGNGDVSKVFEWHAFIVMFHSGPISYEDRLYSGLTATPEYTHVMFTPKCLFDPQSALLHEFVHMMFGIQRNDDMDNQHVNVRWHTVPILAAALANKFCEGYLSPFGPDPTDTSIR